MEDNKSVVSSTETEQTEQTVQTEAKKEEKQYSRSELNKIVNTEKEKLRVELMQEFENKKSEAEKLAKMDTEQKLTYELEESKKEMEKYKNLYNSSTLQNQANSYANEKGLPIGYIEDLDYSKETAETIKEKIDKLVKLRSSDLDGYLKEKLKQNPPKEVNTNTKVEDPYLQGFKNYRKK